MKSARFCFAYLLTISFCFSLPVAGEGLRAGAARIDITPETPVTLAGYASRTNLSRGVHDPLSARVLAFAQDGHRLVLVSLDNLGFYNQTAQPLREAILQATQLQPAELFLCAIHTHSAPSLTLNAEKGHSNNVAYTRGLEGKLVEVVRQALGRMAPVEIGVGSGSSPVGANRRAVVQDNSGQTKIILGRNPSVLTDREVQVLKVARAGQSGVQSVLFAYATHSTSLGPRNYIISGDVHGLAEQFLENYLGGGVVVPGFAGASGNVDPWFRVLPEFNTTNGWIPEPVLLGTVLGEEVAHVLEKIQPSVTNAPIKAAIKTIEMPGKARGEQETNAPAGPASIVITVACLGDIAFVGLGGEVFNEIGQAIKTASPFAHTFIFTHCNGAAGYVPTRASYAQGGYEVQSSSFSPGADEGVIEEVQGMLAKLREP